jgi:hypothetical protein
LHEHGALAQSGARAKTDVPSNSAALEELAVAMEDPRTATVGPVQRAADYRERAERCLRDMEAQVLPIRRQQLQIAADRWLALAEAEDRMAARMHRDKAAR